MCFTDRPVCEPSPAFRPVSPPPAGIAQLALYAAYSGGPGPALTADGADSDLLLDGEGAAAAAKAQLKEPLLQRSTSAGGGLYSEDLDAYSLLVGTGGGGGGGGGSRAGVGPHRATAADREAAEALAAAALAWKGADGQQQPLVGPAKLDAAA